MANYRGGRINEEIKKEISNIIMNKMWDPRLKDVMISVTAVEVTKDLKYAKVFVSIFGAEEKTIEALKVIKKSAGFIRKEVSSAVKLRNTPELIFELDNSINRALHIDSLLSKIKEKENHE